jgi:hypothetical protein
MVMPDKVHILVDKSYFDTIFEPTRIRLQKKFGINNLSQQKFTAFLAKSKTKINIPKIKMPKIKNTLRMRKGGFGLNF